MDFIKDFEVKKEEGSQVTIVGEIPYAELEKERAVALQKLGANIEMDGFRKGHVPENILIERIGEMALLSEMAERALAKVYPTALAEHKIDALGYPQIQITKIAKDNPLGFTATVAVVPDMELPDYKAIAAEANKTKESLEVTDEEVDTQIKDIQRQKIAYERLQQKAAAKAEADQKKADLGDATELPTPESEAKKTAEAEHVHDENCDHDHDEHEHLETEEDLKKLPLPELTDEYVKTLGQPGQFETVEDFKTKLREHLAIEKERDVTAKHRAAITDKIIENTKVELPQVLIDSEIEQMFGQMEGDLAQNNLKLEDYLAHIKKTKEDLKKEWAPHAEHRAKLQLILNEIAKQEQITPDENEVKMQVDRLMSQYKDANERGVRTYVSSMLTNEAVLKMLEEQK